MQELSGVVTLCVQGVVSLCIQSTTTAEAVAQDFTNSFNWKYLAFQNDITSIYVICH